MTLEPVKKAGLVFFMPSALEGVAFTTRYGGRSRGRFESLNLGERTADGSAAVGENRRLVAAALGIAEKWTGVRQVHGRAVYHASKVSPAALVEADAIVGGRQGPPIAVVTADCLPIAVTGPSTRAAVHVGWRGLCAGVIDECITAARDPGPDLTAVIGPSIGPCHFETGPDVAEAFEAQYPAAPGFVVRKGRHEHFDLWAAARWVLDRLGVSVAPQDPPCTFCDPAFFSHRRDGETGRQALVMWG